MQQQFPLNQKQEELCELLQNTSHKGKCFIETQLDQKLKKQLHNTFELLPTNEVRQVTSSLQQMRMTQDYSEIQTQLNDSVNYCNNFENSLRQQEGAVKQRRCISCCFLICSGINISCVFGLYLLFFVFSTPFSEGYQVSSFHSQFKPFQSSETIEQPQIFDIYYLFYWIKQIVLFSIKLISGFWSIIGFVFTMCCLCGCCQKYVETWKRQIDRKKLWRKRIIQNRKQQ